MAPPARKKAGRPKKQNGITQTRGSTYCKVDWLSWPQNANKTAADFNPYWQEIEKTDLGRQWNQYAKEKYKVDCEEYSALNSQIQFEPDTYDDEQGADEEEFGEDEQYDGGEQYAEEEDYNEYY
ncbi:hypothetical protein FA13DRAFT_1784921 [Coprinellus micaceus]|uniref:Uncharacterized protein n=1 Tax=Coprinellus micaceus TaxID=71717 RepID=A0A4Y7TWQ4_COPMI|nr:hypothetical protein FA13DRAFT_1784921 [Coprinellus micaceus]